MLDQAGVNALLQRKGYNDITVGTFEDNTISQKAATVSALQKHVLGYNTNGSPITPTERQAEGLYKNLFTEAGEEAGSRIGVRNSINNKKLTQAHPEHDLLYRMIKRDALRETGTPTFGGGLESPYGYGFQGNRLANYWSAGAQSMFFGDTGRIVKEGLMNSVGMMTEQQKYQLKYGSFLNKAGALAMPGASLYFIGNEILNNGNVLDAVAMSVSGTAGFAGFNIGKHAGGMLTPRGKILPGGAITGSGLRIATQTVLGLTGFALGFGVTTALYEGAKDMADSDSAIAKAANSQSKAKAMGATNQTGLTLTMRQKALQQLSQSQMNERANTLGNEAAILKNLM